MEESKKQILTSAQIEHIFKFTSKKYIKFYDVQLELVDHVASKIEDLMAGDTSLTFEMALQKVYKSYGVYGFTKVEQAKCDELMNMWKRRIWSFLYSYLTLPKIFLTLLLTFLFYNILKFMPEIPMETSLWQMVAFGITFFLMIVYNVFSKQRKLKSHHKFAVVEIYHMFTVGMIYWFYVPIQGFQLVPYSLYWCLLISILLAFSVIVFYGLAFVFPNELEQHIKDKYAHLNLEMA